jgi:hypothetical protein
VTPHGAPAHITIAYANTEGVPAAEAITAVEKLNASGASAVAVVQAAALVLLERHPRSYAGQAIAQIPLAGTGHQTPAGC